MVSKLNIIIIIVITIFMGVMLAVSTRPATDIALVGGVMALLNCGVPVNIMLDKFIEVKKAVKYDN